MKTMWDERHPLAVSWREWASAIGIISIFGVIFGVMVFGIVTQTQQDHVREATAAKLCLSQYGSNYHLQDYFRYRDGTYGGSCVEVQMTDGIEQVVDEKTVQFRL